MAIAPLQEGVPGDGEVALTLPWPRPGLHLALPGEGRAIRCVDEGNRSALHVPQRTAEEEEVEFRRSRRSARHLRRRILSVVAVAGAAVALALPVASIGGQPVSPVVAASSPGAVGSLATLYVVQPGDTLWSIASWFDPGGDPRPMVAALEKEIGSATVVPGERIRIP